MPPAQKAEAKAAPQLNHTNGSDQRSKNSTNTSTNGNKHNGNSTSSSYHAQRQNQSNRRMGQQTVATLPAGVAPRTAAAPSSNHGYPYNQSHSAIPGPPQQPTPLFQRLVTEEVQELKAYARIIENQNRRLVELEKIHGDLENRLEVEARERAHLETTLERRERSWTKKYHELETDRDQWMSVVSQEKAKNDRLYDQVVRKDQDIHRMLQRKYDNQRESGPGQQMRNMRHNERQSQGTSPRQTQHSQDSPHQRMGTEMNKSPHEILATTGSMESVRIRNVTNLLNDFFAI